MKHLFKSLVISVLTAEAKLLLRRKRPTIVAICGSVGKTSAKDAIYAALKDHRSVRKSEKSFNSDIGVPLTVLGLPNAWSNPLRWVRNMVDGFFTALFSSDYPEVLVLETGIDQPGDMERLVSWLQPDIAVLTRLPEIPVHVENFSSVDAVTEEEMLLVHALKPEGKLVYNQDDTIINAQLREVRQEAIGYGRYSEAAFRASKDRVVYHDDRPMGIEFTVTHQGVDHDVALAGTIGTQQLYAVCAALAVSRELGVAPAAAAESVTKLETPPGRMRIIEGLKATVLIDDSYNSSPVAAESALQGFRELKYRKRKIVVFGDMLELGRHSSTEHHRIGGLIPGAADLLLTVGIRARGFAAGAQAAGMDEGSILQYEDVARAGQELQSFLRPGDAVLVKGSQGIRAERIIEEVMADPQEASRLLVRQDRVWKTIV